MSKVLSFVAPQFGYILNVASGQTVSGTIDLVNNTLVGILFPTITSTTITFQTSSTLGGTYVNLTDGAGNTISKTVASNSYVYLDPNVFAGIRFLQVTVGTSEGSARILQLVVRPIT